MVIREGTQGDDVLSFSFSNTIYGFGGDDFVRGGFLRDIIYAGDGRDTVYSGVGPDLVYGGAGDDFILDGGGASQITGADVLHGGLGNDTIIAANWQAIQGIFSRPAVEWWMFGDAGDDVLKARGGGVANMFGGAGDDILMASAYAFTADMHGGPGDDRLYSEDRARINDVSFDTVSRDGAGTNVTMTGGSGDDVLFGHIQNRDTFVFNPGDGSDVIRNLATGDPYPMDRIDLTGFGFEMSAADVYETYAVERNGRIILSFGEDGRIVILDTPYRDFGSYFESPPDTPLPPNTGTDITPQDVIDALLV